MRFYPGNFIILVFEVNINLFKMVVESNWGFIDIETIWSLLSKNIGHNYQKSKKKMCTAFHTKKNNYTIFLHLMN